MSLIEELTKDEIQEQAEAKDGCWLWIPGYYRYAFTRFVGPIPHGHHIHHTCQTQNCINPEHLYACSPGEHRRIHGQLTREERGEQVAISARIEPELRDALVELAARSERSFAAELRRAIRAYLQSETA